jgi:hypothetical protein
LEEDLVDRTAEEEPIMVDRACAEENIFFSLCCRTQKKEARVGEYDAFFFFERESFSAEVSIKPETREKREESAFSHQKTLSPEKETTRFVFCFCFFSREREEGVRV